MQSELLEATRLGNTEKVRQLIQNGLDVNFSTHEGTPLMAASISGGTEVVSWEAFGGYSHHFLCACSAGLGG